MSAQFKKLLKRPLALSGVIIVSLLTAWLGFHLISQRSARAKAALLAVNPPPPPATIVNPTDADVYKLMFWRKPTQDDRIIHSARMAWVDASGIQCWEWFLVLDPSKALVNFLKDRNPFDMLTLGGEIAVSSPRRPSWFPATSAGLTAQQTPDRAMQVLTDPKTGRLFCRSEGREFTNATQPVPVLAPTSVPSTPKP
jgi:hypothetical protein